VEVHPTDVDVELSGGEVINVGEARFEVLATPGHTPGSLCYLMQRNHRSVLFAGDVILSLSENAGVLGDLGTYSAYLAPRYRGNAKDFLSSLKKLLALPVPDLVLPGHPRQDERPQSAKLTPEQWRSRVEKGVRDMQELVAHYEADGANFLDGNPKQLLPDLHYLGDCRGIAVYCLVTPARLLLFNAPGGQGFMDFLKPALRTAGLESRSVTAVLLTSCDAAVISGLGVLVDKTKCTVIASRAGLDLVRKSCPAGANIRPEDALGKDAWFPLEAIALQGRGLAPVAYQIKCHNKTVLLTGPIPTSITPVTAGELKRSFREEGGNAIDYLESLTRLRSAHPDLWLPAIPVQGQNANLYGSEWANILGNNEKFCR
jgi:glyoxylase-like metal-dependent hydrolase (beta-lactamase superfamily II)